MSVEHLGVTRILVIPDTQCAPGVPLEHLGWCGQAIMQYRPDIIVHIGDHWTLDSLSSYASRRELEGRRYQDDLDAGHEGMRLLLGPLRAYNKRRAANKKAQYNPRLVFCLGNHEQRLERAINEQPHLDGFMRYPDDFGLEAWGWEVHQFLAVVKINGVWFSHFFAGKNSGRPLGGTAHSKLKNVGNSFVMGHQQGLDHARMPLADGNAHQALVAGSFYLHDEPYRGPQGTGEWRGIVVMNDVRNGEWDEMPLSMRYLRAKYG